VRSKLYFYVSAPKALGSPQIIRIAVLIRP
jgi:hypothetical protein